MLGKPAVTLLLIIMVSSLRTIVFADAAPPVFPGYSLSFLNAKSVRMQSQKVTVGYGAPCNVEAVFAIHNPTNETVEKKIGFPFKISAMRREQRFPGEDGGDSANKIYDFTMIFNGEHLKETDVPRGLDIRSDTHYWHGWTCKIKPGLNIAKLTYHIVTSSSREGKWARSLSYMLATDTAWPRQIDTVQVTVHFPRVIAKRQILSETRPSEYVVKDNEIAWRFTPFSPNPRNNVDLCIIDFDVFDKMLACEKVLSASNADNATKLNAAIFFASLAPPKGINISAPSYFKRSYYDGTVLPSLKPEEKAVFETAYKLHKGSGFEDYYRTDDYRLFQRNDSLRSAVLAVMHRIGYFENIEYPVIYKYIEGAKRLFREVVTSEPKNATAWKAYIDKFYLIETGGCSPCVPWVRSGCDCPESQKELVREAFRNCGNDKKIALWNDFLFPRRAPLPDTIELERFAKPTEKVMIKIKHPDHSWSEKTLSADELGALKQAYTMSDKGFMVLTATNIDKTLQDKLVAILGGCNVYKYKFCRDLRALKTPAK